MLGLFLKGRVAVFIDAANVFHSQQKLGWKISYKKLKEYFIKECDLSEIHFYTAIDPENLGQKRMISKLRGLGVNVVTRPIKRISIASGRTFIKGNVDIELSLGMIDNKDKYDTAVLMSGDSDFALVTERLKSLGKNVVVISTDDRISKELLEITEYINLGALKEYLEYELYS